MRPFQQLHSWHIPGLQFAGEWPGKRLFRACIRAPLCEPALSEVLQRLGHGKDLPFYKYAQCINNACPCVAAAGKNACRISGAKGYWCERHRSKCLAVAFCFSNLLTWCALGVENLLCYFGLVRQDQHFIHLLRLFYLRFLMSWDISGIDYIADLYQFFSTPNQVTHHKHVHWSNSHNFWSLVHRGL